MNKASQNMRQHRLMQLTLKEQKKKQKVKAGPLDQTADQVENKTETVVTSNIELRLSNHLSQLKEIRSIDKKIELKKQWLPEYQGYIDAVLSQSPAPQNHVLMYLMVWATDVQDFNLAAKIAQFGILNEMVMPEGFSRTVAEVIAEQVGEACCNDADLAKKHATLLQDIADMVHGEDLVHQAHAKLYKAIGIAYKDIQPTQALDAFKNALRLDPNSGVKTLIAQIEKVLKRSSTVSIHDAPVGSQDVTEVTDPASTDT